MFQSLFTAAPRKRPDSGLGAGLSDEEEDPRIADFQHAWKKGADLGEMFGREPFKLHSSVGGSGTDNHRSDVAKVETFLHRTGHYNPMTEDGPNGWHNPNLDRAIRGFQKENDLKVDGVLKPGGPTISALRASVTHDGAKAQTEPKPQAQQPVQEANAGAALLRLLPMAAPMVGAAGEAARRAWDNIGKENASSPPSQPAPPPPPQPGLEPPNKAASNTTELKPPKINLGGYDNPITDPNYPNILIFPAQPGHPHDGILERKGSPLTKTDMDDYRDKLLAANPGWTHLKGGREQSSGKEKPEYHIPGRGAKFGNPHIGGGYTDMTFKTPDGRYVHVQTVDVDRNGKPSKRELDNAERIRRLFDNQRDESGNRVHHDVLLVPKRHRLPRQR